MTRQSYRMPETLLRQKRLATADKETLLKDYTDLEQMQKQMQRDFSGQTAAYTGELWNRVEDATREVRAKHGLNADLPPNLPAISTSGGNSEAVVRAIQKHMVLDLDDTLEKEITTLLNDRYAKEKSAAPAARRHGPCEKRRPRLRPVCRETHRDFGCFQRCRSPTAILFIRLIRYNCGMNLARLSPLTAAVCLSIYWFWVVVMLVRMRQKTGRMANAVRGKRLAASCASAGILVSLC